MESIVEGEPGYDPYVIPIFGLFEPCISYKRNFYEKISVCSLESVHKLWRRLTCYPGVCNRMERGYSHVKFPKIIASAYLKATYFFQLSWIILKIFELFSYVKKQSPELFFTKNSCS